MGVDVLFGFGSQQDFKDATQVIGSADQGGLSLPDRDYYLKDDKKMTEVRGQLQEHIGKMVALVAENPASGKGVAKDDGSGAPQVVLSIETALAKVALDRTSRRDPHRIYHRLERAGLMKAAAHFFGMLTSPPWAPRQSRRST